MGFAENGVVDFLTSPVKHGHIVIGILGTTVTLDGIITGITKDVEIVQKIVLYDIVRIKNYYVIKSPFNCFPSVFHRLNGILHSLGF